MTILGANAFDNPALAIERGGVTDWHGVLNVLKTLGVEGGRGVVTLNEANPVTVADTSITASSIVIFTLSSPNGTVGAIPAIKTITPGTGFTVAGTALDTSDYNYLVIS